MIWFNKIEGRCNCRVQFQRHCLLNGFAKNHGVLNRERISML